MKPIIAHDSLVRLVGSFQSILVEIDLGGEVSGR